MNKIMKYGKKPHPHVYIFILLLLVSFAFLNEGIRVTGYAAASGGTTADAGNTAISNPHFGAVKGTLTFVIKDSGAVVSSEKGSNYRLYFSKQTLSDYALVKASPDSFDGSLSSIDPDGAVTVCSTSSFVTQKLYYDENNDGVQQPSEQDVYSVVTDANGCFAAKVATGNWDIYG